MVFAEPDVEAILGKIGGVVGKCGSLRVERLAGDDPTHVRPPGAFLRRVRVALFIAVLMVDAVRGYPGDWSAFKGQSAAHGEKIFDHPGHLISAVYQQTVIAHADSTIDGKHIQHDCNNQVCPTEEEQRGDRADVKDDHKDGSNPDQTGFILRSAHANFSMHSRRLDWLEAWSCCLRFLFVYAHVFSR